MRWLRHFVPRNDLVKECERALEHKLLARSEQKVAYARFKYEEKVLE